MTTSENNISLNVKSTREEVKFIIFTVTIYDTNGYGSTEIENCCARFTPSACQRKLEKVFWVADKR